MFFLEKQKMILSRVLMLLFLAQCANCGPLSRWVDLLNDDVPPKLRCQCKETGDSKGTLACHCRGTSAPDGATPAPSGPSHLRCQCGPLPGDTSGRTACKCRANAPTEGAPPPSGHEPKKPDHSPEFEAPTAPPPGPGHEEGTHLPPHDGPDHEGPDHGADGISGPQTDADSFGDTWTYVVCARRRAGLGKPYWEWLYDQNGDYLTVTGTWLKHQCAYGGVDPFLIARATYSSILRQCRYKGYETAQPANGLHSYWYSFQVDLYLTEYFKEKTWFSFERFPQTPVERC